MQYPLHVKKLDLEFRNTYSSLDIFKLIHHDRTPRRIIKSARF